MGIAAVKALSPMPHGFYSVDIKENVEDEDCRHTAFTLQGKLKCLFPEALKEFFTHKAYIWASFTHAIVKAFIFL
jgi:hypothetical protein